MTMSRAKNADEHEKAVEVLEREGLLSRPDPAQIRIKLIGLCYRPDWSSEQLIGRCKELEAYVTG